MKSPLPIWTVLCLTGLPTATLGQELAPSLSLYDLERRVGRFDMPGRLDEISGLAMTADGRLFGHDDERATIHEIDPVTGELGKRFSLGDPPVQGDFEGLAVAGDRFFLVTSLGRLFEFREAEDRATTVYRETDTGFGETCEAEGLDFDARDQVLLIACKQSTRERGSLVIHRLPLDPSRPRLTAIEIPRARLAALGLDTDFQPSSLAVSPSGSIYLASAAPEALLEVGRDGGVLAGVRLSRDRHPQSEGLAFGPDGSLYISDERNGSGAARITRYGRANPVGAPR